jgi:hypothetical protein
MKPRITTVFATVALAVVSWLSCAVPAAADTCPVGSDTCTTGQPIQTPAGTVTVSAGANNVVTVVFTPSKPNTLLFAVPFAIPPGPPGIPALTRTTVVTAAGVVNIDTVAIPPGPPARFSLPNLVIVSIHPPSPCRVAVNGYTVVFTPVVPPGPPA